jgi:Uma2 family endonuclease
MTLLVPKPESRGFLLRDVSWEFYGRLLREIGDQRVFVTYDHGSLELMSPSWKHERFAELFGSLIRLIAAELKVPLIGGGSTTFRSQASGVGLEPDRCFYIQHVAAVTGKQELDLAIDPPPDLVVEIEISRRMLDRLDLYARLGVPEVWRCDGRRLEVLLLTSDGYQTSIQSAAFPRIPIDQVIPILDQSWLTDETQWAEAVRQWIRSAVRA